MRIDAEDLAGLLEPIQERFGVPALGAAYVRDETLRGLGVVGRRRVDRPDPATVEDRFHLGSCTKAMTATLAGILIDAGALEWDTPLGEVLPVPMHPDFQAVTLPQLLAHRSGIPGRQTPEEYESLQRRYREYRGPIRQQRLALAETALSQPPVHPPGTVTSYSNVGYIVAGAVLEAVAAQDWEELIVEQLFRPLGMQQVGFGAPGTAEKIDQPWAHTPDQEPVPPGPDADNPPVLGPAGRVHSTLTDWARFLTLSLRGARGEPTPLLATPIFDRLFAGSPGDYGLGWGIAHRDWAGGRAYTHTGSNTLWYAVAWLAPERNAALLAATNWGTETAFQAIDAAVGAMVQQYL